MRTNLTLAMLIAHGFACGDTTGDKPIEAEADDIPIDVNQEGYDAFRARFEAQHGPTVMRDPDEPVLIEDPNDIDYGSEGEPDDSGDVDKAIVAAGWGFAAWGNQKTQTTGLNPKAHCELFGRACDGQIHREADDIKLDNLNEVNSSLVGRCGRFDGGADWAFFPCVLPRMSKARGGKQWTWMYDRESCPNEPSARDIIRWGIDRALETISSQSDVVFVEVTSDPQITLGCETLAGTSMAAGYPLGDLTLQYAADVTAEEVCDDSSYPLHATNGTGNYIYHLGDMAYTYTKARLGIDWSDFWGFANGCSTNVTKLGRIARTVFLHELAHIFGFVHQNWSDARPGFGGVTNLMRASLTCAQAEYGLSEWNGRMYWTLSGADTRVGSSLTIDDQDLSCLFPQ